MLKKAAIVTAATATGLVAVSPLAFAGDLGGHHHHGHADVVKQANSISDDSAQIGLVNVGDVDLLNNVGVALPVNVNAVIGALFGTATGGQGTGPVADLGGLGDSIVQGNDA